MSEENENEQLRKELEKKYNLNLNISNNEGEQTYWDLRKYFTKEIEEDNLLISTDYATMCCHRTDIKSMKEEFNKKLKEFIKDESKEVCQDQHAELLESAIGKPCQYSIKSK